MAWYHKVLILLAFVMIWWRFSGHHLVFDIICKANGGEERTDYLVENEPDALKAAEWLALSSFMAFVCNYGWVLLGSGLVHYLFFY